MSKNAKQRKQKRGSSGTLVLASTKPYSRRELPMYTVASYKCECGHEGAVQAGLEPHCSKCGTAVATVKAGAGVKRIEAEKSAVSLECASCSVHNIMSTTAAVAFGGTVHCASCGDQLEYDVAEVAGADFESDIDLQNDTGSDDIEDAIHSGIEDDDAAIEDDEGLEEDADADEDDLGEDDDNIDDLENSDPEDGSEEDTREAEDYLGGDVIDDDESSDEDESVVSKVLPTPIVASLSKKVVAATRLVPEVENDRLHLFSGNHCVATLMATDKNAKVFGTPKHIGLIEASLAQDGFEKTTEKFGFEVAQVKMSKTKALDRTVAKIQRDEAARLSGKVKSHTKALRQSLEIAAVGLNRDVFAATHANPLKVAFTRMLKGLGVDDVTASIKIQEAFAQGGDEYASTLLEKATEIASYDQTLRNQMASTFSSLSAPTPFVAQASDDHDLDDDLEEEACDDADRYFAGAATTVTARLDQPLRRVQETSAATEQPKRSMFGRMTLSHTPKA